MDFRQQMSDHLEVDFGNLIFNLARFVEMEEYLKVELYMSAMINRFR